MLANMTSPGCLSFAYSPWGRHRGNLCRRRSCRYSRCHICSHYKSLVVRNKDRLGCRYHRSLCWMPVECKDDCQGVSNRGRLTQHALTVALELQGTKELSVIAMPWVLKHLFSARATYSSGANKKMERMLRQRKQLSRELCSMGKEEWRTKEREGERELP
jgi:hypothetical protein